MNDYIQGKDGKMKGRIGSGKKRIPSQGNTKTKTSPTPPAETTTSVQDFLNNAEIALHSKYLKTHGAEAEWAYQFAKNAYPTFSKDSSECIVAHMATGTKMGYTPSSALEPRYVDYDEAEIDHYMKLEPHPTLDDVYVSQAKYLEAAYDDLPEDTYFAVRMTETDYDRLLVHGNEIVGEWADYDAEAYVVESQVYEDEFSGSIEQVDSSSTSVVRNPDGTPIAINTYLSAERAPAEPDWDNYRDD